MEWSTPLAAALVLSAANLLLLCVLVAVWLGNYRTFRRRELLALCCFAVVLAGENAAALVFHLGMSMFYAETAGALAVATTLRALQFVALCFLAWATLQ
ncbi:hypothetical protein [Natronobiforma cellulositropha]|uniref:hypothetical protein n=1 Tax=Natronobiforma cellulositropha TaxID=1679076 RepID=UPI0021D587AF|nr:hypothetical protein [Natronobiforma cellulositropha]